MKGSATAAVLACAVLALLHCAVAQEELVRVGNFLRAVRYSPSQAPSCIVPACNDESNINFVLPPLCCNLLARGPFVSFDYVTTAVNFSVPQFLAAALATPVCRGDVFARTQAAFAGLASSSYLLVNVFEGRAAKIPWCTAAGQHCLTAGITQINLYVSQPCATDYCPYSSFGSIAKRDSKGGAFCVMSRVLRGTSGDGNATATINSVTYDVVEQGDSTLVHLDMQVSGDVFSAPVAFGSSGVETVWSRFGELVAERSRGPATLQSLLQRMAEERVLSPAAPNATDNAYATTVCM